VKPLGQQLVLPKSTMLDTDSMPLAAPISASCLLHGCLLINRQCIQASIAPKERKKRRVKEGK